MSGLARVRRYGLGALLIGGAAAVAWTVYSQPRESAAPPPQARVAGAGGDAIAALGRILPEDGIIRLSGRSLSGQPSIVATVLVKDGDAVQRGQLVATLNSHDQLEAAWRAAESRVAVARSRVAQVKAGAKPGDLQAQRAEIARLEAELADANRDQLRYQTLLAEKVVSPSELEARQLRSASSAQLLAQAKEQLHGLEEVRGVDIAYAESELQAAVSAAAQARAEFEQSQIRSPIDGHVIAIQCWPGEEVKAAGIMELGKTDRMYAVAEVDESDLPHLRVGQRASISGAALPETLTGVVEYIASKVARNDQDNLDPVAPSDARVVQARVRLDDAAKAARVINAQVTVLIAR